MREERSSSRSYVRRVPYTPSPEWTSEQVEAALAWRDEGVLCKEIGRRLGKTKNAVIGKLDGLYDSALPFATMEDRLAAIPAFPDAIHCVWPHGHVGDPGFGFCGALVAAYGLPYCGEHAALAYNEMRGDAVAKPDEDPLR